jgi:tetratricopeptide (TPR) repeat protein
MKKVSIFFVTAITLFSSFVSFAQLTPHEEFFRFIRMSEEARRLHSDSVINSYRLAIANTSVTEHSELYRKIGQEFLRYYSFEDVKIKRDSSIFYFKKAIVADTGNTTAYINLGDVYDLTEKTDSAMYYYFKANGVSSLSQDAYKGIIKMYKKKYKPDSVFYYSKKLLQVNPKNGFALLETASWFDAQKGYNDSALIYYQQLVAAKYADDIARERVGYLVMAVNSNDTTPLTYFTQMLNEWPSAWRQYYNIACYHNNRGEKEKAMEYLEKAFQRGLKNKNQLYAEPYLATVRDTELFKKLVAKYLPV